MLQGMRRIPISDLSFTSTPVETAYCGPEIPPMTLGGAAPKTGSPNPLVLLHGFDSSALEFRRFFSAVRGDIETYAVDLLGWGFTANQQSEDMRGCTIGPKEKREHLYQFWKQVLGGRKMILCGASLGGAIVMVRKMRTKFVIFKPRRAVYNECLAAARLLANSLHDLSPARICHCLRPNLFFYLMFIYTTIDLQDFAFHHPEAVEKIVLVDAQGYIEGAGPMGQAPVFLAKMGVAVLRSVPLRNAANKMAYFNKDKYATEDAMLIGRLHTHLPHWTEANVKFMQSGGYKVTSLIPQMETETLITWGKNDEILDPKYAEMFKRDLKNSRLVYIDECGHCSHLEQPEKLRELVLEFVDNGLKSEVIAAAAAM